MLAWLHRWIKKYDRREEDPQVLSYQTLRKTIGWLGILLPFIMIIGAWLFWDCTTLQPSISHYYYTNMREIFVGVICAVALFLFTYTGPNKVDGWVSNIAGLFGLGIALFPTTVLCKTFTGFSTESLCYPCQQNGTSLTRIPYHASLHLVCAALFFITLSLMSIFLFRLSKCPTKDQTPQKRKRNVIFLVCGIVMLGSIAAAGIYIMVSDHEHSTFVLWAEAIALLAFGISWLTKGEAIMKDTQPKEKTAA
jgi:hypothetical protein